ncbi:MAG: bifunctional phosphoribosylaminoimidazolecarboxamide formyltransferase/IMP cyclohydrolase [Ferrimicrobium sp.]
MRALISLYDKSELKDLAEGLIANGVDLVASGGTAAALETLGLAHERVEDLTGFGELFDGRVKTLHPAIHGPLLADRARPEHLAQLAEAGWAPIDLVFVNLYPFLKDPSVELIDIGGVAMLRAAAKNFEWVTVVVDSSDYAMVIDCLRAKTLGRDLRRSLAAKTFRVTATYDAAISSWLGDDVDTELPAEQVLVLEHAMSLRYGENPHQVGGLYRTGDEGGWPVARWLGSLGPSYLNIFDADAALGVLARLGDEPAAVIVKHGGPCGVAVASDVVTAYRRAFEGDPLSAFGGVVAINRALSIEFALALLANPKCDVVVAPAVEEGAVELLHAKRKKLHVAIVSPSRYQRFSIRSVSGGVLLQTTDALETRDELLCQTSRIPSERERGDAWLAMAVAASAQSNGIAIVADGWARGVGQGQPSRVDAARIAVAKAGEGAIGAAAASDAFFPFPDGLMVLVDAGVTTVVAPSGSIRDAEIVETAEHAGVSLLFAPRRHFRH